MVAVVQVEVESQRQGSVFTFHRLAFKSEGRKFLPQGVKFGLIVGSFQDKKILCHKITNYGLIIAQKL